VSVPKLVSVVVPVYNGAPFLFDALASIAAQKYEPIEVIIVDDGSTDESSVIAGSFLAHHDGRLLHQQNLGPAAARNTGIAVARGELITFLDADDEMVADRVAFQVEYLDDHAMLDVVIGSEEIHLDPGIDPPPWLSGNGGQTTYPLMTMMALLPAFERVGLFDTSFSVAEDTDWVLRARAAGVRIEFVDRVVLRRRIHGANLMYRAEDRRHALFRALHRLRQSGANE
jgi:glycosyltransferase involved in cell wall biosynthesis